MVTKSVLSLMSSIVLLSMISGNQLSPPVVEPVVAKEASDRTVMHIAGVEQETPRIEPVEIEVGDIDETGVTTEPTETLPPPYTPDIKVLFEEMTFVQVLSEKYGWIESVCAGVGLKNIKPSPDGPRLLIPNAGDLSVDGSNVAIRLDPDGQITFIPRVPGQRIRVPMDLGDKLTGHEVESLTLDEALQLMAAEKLIWTAKGYGPYGTGHGLPGHIAECDPRYSKSELITDAPRPVVAKKDTVPVPRLEAPELSLYTPDIKVLFEEMTFVQVLSEEYARIESVCAGVGLKNIKPSPDGPRLLIPNAGDLSVDGSNVAIRLDPDGQITFIPRVPGQRIRVPMDLGDKLTGHEVESLTLDEALQLMAAEKLIWTAKGYGPYGTGHGLPGHIAECDPRYIGF